MEGGRERKSLGPRANCTDFEIGSVDASERASPLIDRGRESEFDSSPCDFFGAGVLLGKRRSNVSERDESVDRYCDGREARRVLDPVSRSCVSHRGAGNL